MKPITLSAPSYATPMSPEKEESPGIFLFLPDVSGLKSLPECGEITFKYERKKLSLTESDEGGLSAELELCEILKVKACAPEKGEDSDTKTEAVVDKLFAEAHKASKEESDD